MDSSPAVHAFAPARTLRRAVVLLEATLRVVVRFGAPFFLAVVALVVVLLAVAFLFGAAFFFVALRIE